MNSMSTSYCSSTSASCPPNNKNPRSLEVVPDAVLGYIGSFIASPFAYLLSSKNMKKQATQALKGQNELVNRLVFKSKGKSALFQKGFLGVQGWQSSISVLDFRKFGSQKDCNFVFTRQEVDRFVEIFPHVTELHLDNVALSSKIAKIKTLQKLCLSNFSNENLERLTKLPHLRELTIKFPNFNLLGPHLPLQVPKLLKLEKLTIQEAGGVCSIFSDNEIAQLSDLPNLKELDLTGTMFAKTGFQSVAKIKKLQSLSIDDWQVTQEDLDHLSECSQFQKLTLKCAHKWGLMSTSHSCPRYKELNGMIQQLKNKLPHLQVEYDGKALVQIV